MRGAQAGKILPTRQNKPKPTRAHAHTRALDIESGRGGGRGGSTQGRGAEKRRDILARFFFPLRIYRGGPNKRAVSGS